MQELRLVGAYLFGALSALPFLLQAREVDVTPEFLYALPYVMTIVVLVLVSTGLARRRLGAPAALGFRTCAKNGRTDAWTSSLLARSTKRCSSRPSTPTPFRSRRTDVMVALNFDRARPEVVLNLNEVSEPAAGRARTGRSGSAPDSRTRRRSAASSPRRCPRLPKRRAPSARRDPEPRDDRREPRDGFSGRRCTSPLFVENAEVELASVRGRRRLALGDFLVGVKQNALEPDELIVSVLVEPSGQPQTFMKVGPRNAMVIAVCSLAVVADRRRGELRASFGSSSPVVRPASPHRSTRQQPFASVSPRPRARSTTCGGRQYRRHALRVLAQRALERCVA